MFFGNIFEVISISVLIIRYVLNLWMEPNRQTVFVYQKMIAEKMVAAGPPQ